MFTFHKWSIYFLNMALARPRDVGALRHVLMHSHQHHHQHANVLKHEGLYTFAKCFLDLIYCHIFGNCGICVVCYVLRALLELPWVALICIDHLVANWSNFWGPVAWTEWKYQKVAAAATRSIVAHHSCNCARAAIAKELLLELTNLYLCLCLNCAFNYHSDNGDYDFDSGDDILNVHCRPLISLLATLLATRIFCYNPTRTLLEVRKPYSL